MNRLELMQRSRSLVRDISNSFFREDDIVNYLNEGIDRIAQRIPIFTAMPYLTNNLQEVTYLPKQWQHLLAVYCAARLCTHDERHYQAGTFMNEFETKLEDLSASIDNHDTAVVDGDGNPVEQRMTDQYVRNNYFMLNDGVVRDWTRYDGPKDLDDDEGPEGAIM